MAAEPLRIIERVREGLKVQERMSNEISRIFMLVAIIVECNDSILLPIVYLIERIKCTAHSQKFFPREYRDAVECRSHVCNSIYKRITEKTTNIATHRIALFFRYNPRWSLYIYPYAR